MPASSAMAAIGSLMWGDLEGETFVTMIRGSPARYEDNSDVVALIDGRGGMLDMLDEDDTTMVHRGI